MLFDSYIRYIERRMMLLLNLIVILSVDVKAKKTPCLFVPNDSAGCIAYLTITDIKPGCLNTSHQYEFTGMKSTLDGKDLISIRPFDMDLENTKPMWINRNNGKCKDNCCSEPALQKRILGLNMGGCLVDCKYGQCYNRVYCTCPVGLYGLHCEHVKDLCNSNPCGGGGTCHNSPTGYSCSCKHGYAGKNCNQVLDHCSPDPCHGNGNCFTSSTGYFCKCHVGHTGPECQSEIDHCKPDTCHGRGVCNNSPTGYSCTCNQGYTGVSCELDINHCNPDPCNGQGDCFNSQSRFLCQCHTGYHGSSCQYAPTTYLPKHLSATDLTKHESTADLSKHQCTDKHTNCYAYSNDQCGGIYKPWAIENCPYRCGFCLNKPPCADKIDNCQQFGGSVCTEPNYSAWVRENCRKFCNKCF